MSNNQHEPTTAEIRHKVTNLAVLSGWCGDEIEEAEWIMEALLDRLEAAERWNTEKTALNESLKAALKTAEATIKAVSDLISKRKFSYDERTERSGDMGALFGEIERVNGYPAANKK